MSKARTRTAESGRQSPEPAGARPEIRFGRIWMLLLLTGVLLVAGAFLPRISFFIQDRMAGQYIGYSSMQALNLEMISSQDTTMPVMAKLASFRNMETMAISPAQASMTEEQALSAAESQMEDYIQADLFQWFDWTSRTVQPRIGFRLADWDQTTTFFVYWNVCFVNEGDPYQMLNLDIDDETGKILRIHYETLEDYTTDSFWDRNRERMEAFTEIYFRQLDLTEKAEYAATAGAGYAYWDRDGDVSCARYSLVDEQFGRTTLEFYVNGAGSLMVIFPL